jgi:acyl-coenzyme A synthetase/AMP-(fatty) acid ligase
MPDVVLDETAIVAFCRERLAGFESPKRVVAVEDLPVTVGGKVLKYKLRQLMAQACAHPTGERP